MTDTKLLRSLIAEKGIKLGFIAESLGVAPYTLQMKIDNIHEFKQSEIAIMCDLLGVKSLKMKEALFFASKVGRESTMEVAS